MLGPKDPATSPGEGYLLWGLMGSVQVQDFQFQDLLITVVGGGQEVSRDTCRVARRGLVHRLQAVL